MKIKSTVLSVGDPEFRTKLKRIVKYWKKAGVPSGRLQFPTYYPISLPSVITEFLFS
jgi:hypothetical protein